MPQLHILTDTTPSPRWSHAELAARAIAGGADAVQFRCKERDMKTLLREGAEVVRLCRAAGVLSIINDRVDVALALGADGVHLGAEDMPVDVARRLMGPDAVIGATVRSGEDAIRAAAEGASYVGLGPIFSTTSKSVDHAPLGLEGLAQAASLSPIPIIAIAGITLDNAGDVVAAGAAGVAVLGAVAGSHDPESVVREFRRRLDETAVRSGRMR